MTTKVLHLVTSLNPGGIERWVLTMLENVDRSECEMDVCCKGLVKGPWTKQAEEFGAKVFWLPLTPDHILFGLGLLGLLKRGRYDILHVHTGAYSGFPVWIGKTANVKVITTFHSVQFPPHYRILKIPLIRSLRRLYSTCSLNLAIRQSNYIVGVSLAAIDAFVPDRSSMREKCRIIYHGVGIREQFSDKLKAAFRCQLGWPPETKVIVNVGMFKPTKNHLGLLDVFEKIALQYPMARLALVGEGILRQEIEKIIVDKRLEKKIALMGRRDNAAEIVGYCDVMLMPSFYEGFGIAAIEASAAGLPVVASRVEGLVEAVIDGQTGLLFAAHDNAGMAQAVIRLFSDPELSITMGCNGRENVRRNFSIDKMLNQHLILYSDCMAS